MLQPSPSSPSIHVSGDNNHITVHAPGPSGPRRHLIIAVVAVGLAFWACQRWPELQPLITQLLNLALGALGT